MTDRENSVTALKFQNIPLPKNDIQYYGYHKRISCQKHESVSQILYYSCHNYYVSIQRNMDCD